MPAPDSSPLSAHFLSTQAENTSSLKLFKQVWPYIRPYKLAMFGAATALLTAGMTVLGIARGLKYVIDGGFIEHNPAMLDNTLFGLLLAIVLLAASTFIRYFCISWLGERVIGDMRKAVYAHILKLSPAFFEITRSGDILSRLYVDTSILQTLIGSSISVALRNIVLVTGGLIMMIMTSPKLTIVVFAGIVVIVSPIVYFGRRVRKLSRTHQERIADINAAAEETIHGIRTVQAFNHETLSRDAYDTQIESAVAAAIRSYRARGLWSALVIVTVFSGIGVMLWIGGHDVLNHTLTPGQLSSFITYAAIAAGAVGAISESMGDLHRAEAATERVFDMLSVEPQITTPAVPARMPSPPRGEVTFDHVNFSYPARPGVLALRDISFTVKSGERVALVGPSGAGKTTLYQMLLRFYDPQSGAVRIDGVDIKSADPHEVRAHLGIVPQDPTIFSGTAWRNIAFGRPDATQDEIIAAARTAHADEFLSALPQGYDTFLGEKGVRLSGGQRQRLAIARAVLRNPSILLLDEATSALDTENEQLVQTALEELMRDRTTLIIAHRLSTVMNADRILVVENGQVVASGTHQGLIAEGGLYARLASLQFDKAA